MKLIWWTNSVDASCDLFWSFLNQSISHFTSSSDKHKTLFTAPWAIPFPFIPTLSLSLSLETCVISHSGRLLLSLLLFSRIHSVSCPLHTCSPVSSPCQDHGSFYSFRFMPQPYPSLLLAFLRLDVAEFFQLLEFPSLIVGDVLFFHFRK